MTHDYKPELVFYAGSGLLESPVWDDEHDILYFISIEDNMIYSLNEETTEITSFITESPVGAVVLNGSGKLLSAEKEGIYSIDIETKERTFWMHPNEDDRLRYNDGKWDPEGRLLIGTMGFEEIIEGAANLMVIEDGEHKELLTGLSLSNGFDWSQDGRTLYHIDTPTNEIKQYDYHLETGEVSNGKSVIKIQGDGSPDGMCVDPDGNIWAAEFGGKQICQWNPANGEQLARVPMPVSNITSCCIGGPEKDYLYITTAQAEDEQLSGGLFKVKIR